MNEAQLDILNSFLQANKETVDQYGYKQRRILLIDGLNNFIRSFVVVGIANDNGEFFGGVFGTLQTIKLLVETFSPNIVVWCWEGKNSGKRRREIFENYKAGRKTRTSLTRVFEFASPEEEKKNMRQQLIRVKEYLSVLPVYQFEIENLEADDTIAYIVNNLFKKDKKIIVSSDRDYWQLIDDNVNVFRPVKRETITKKEVLDEFGCSPQNYALVKAVVGDKSDEIPGLQKGLGPKTVIKLFPFLAEEKKYEIADILDYAQKSSNLKLAEKYSVFKDQVSVDLFKRNYSLVQLREYNINTIDTQRIRELFITQKPQFSVSQLMLYFMNDRLNSQIKRYDDWHKLFLKVNATKLLNEEDIL
jgi:DNA polymerase-1